MRCRFDSRMGRYHGGVDGNPLQLPGESPGQRNPVGYSPWGLKESDTTKQLNTCKKNQKEKLKKKKPPGMK